MDVCQGGARLGGERDDMIERSLVSLLRGRLGSPRAQRRSAAAPATLANWVRDSASCHLSAVEIFRDLQAEDLEWLATHTTMVMARRGQLVYMPGETSEALFLLKAGKVQIYRLSSDGKKLVLSTLGAQTFFGDMPLAGQQMYGAYAEALEDCTICVLNRGDLEWLIEKRPQVAIRLLEVIGRRLMEAESVIEDFAFKSVSARLATVLVKLAAASAGEELSGQTHQDLAEMVGTYRETATQTLDEFQRRGLVELGRKHIRILDRRGLQTVAEG